MRRLDWRLVRPLEDSGAEASSLAKKIDELLTRAVHGGLSEPEMRRLTTLEERLEARTVSTCETVAAPRIADDPDWETRLIDEYAASELDVELEDYLRERADQHDCARCPYASPFSLYPMDPCEFSAGALEVIVLDVSLWTRAQAEMDPAAMLSLATSLETVLLSGRYRDSDALDARDYLEKAIFFLRFWAEHGFWLHPDDLDVGLTAPDEEAQEREELPGPTYH